jgi:hypothetical protein
MAAHQGHFTTCQPLNRGGPGTCEPYRLAAALTAEQEKVRRLLKRRLSQ